MPYIVSRYWTPIDPDRLRVCRDGKLLLDCTMGLSSLLHPESAKAARSRQWFYTGSPYGAEIVELARQRLPAYQGSDRITLTV